MGTSLSGPTCHLLTYVLKATTIPSEISECSERKQSIGKLKISTVIYSGMQASTIQIRWFYHYLLVSYSDMNQKVRELGRCPGSRQHIGSRELRYILDSNVRCKNWQQWTLSKFCDELPVMSLGYWFPLELLNDQSHHPSLFLKAEF